MENKQSNTKDREFFLTRTLDATIDLVWEVWTKPEHIANWWGPNGFTNTITLMDFRPGGEWDLVMHGSDGTDYKNKNVFKEIILNKKIVYEHASYPHFIATIDFEEQGEQTLINWHMLFDSVEVFLAVAKAHKAEEGQKENVEKLQAYLQKMKKK